MSLDSVAARYSVVGVNGPWNVGVFPDSAMGQAWRQSAGYGYAGNLVTAEPAAGVGGGGAGSFVKSRPKPKTPEKPRLTIIKPTTVEIGVRATWEYTITVRPVVLEVAGTATPTFRRVPRTPRQRAREAVGTAQPVVRVFASVYAVLPSPDVSIGSPSVRTMTATIQPVLDTREFDALVALGEVHLVL